MADMEAKNSSSQGNEVSSEAPRSAGKWTPIPEWTGYFVTRDGRVWSSIDWRGQRLRELKQDLNSDGYPSVRLTVIGERRTRMSVHRLVTAAFVGPRPSPEHEIRHLDGDRTNNSANNLAWGTRAENAADRDGHGRTVRGERHPRAKLTEETVIAIRTACANGLSHSQSATRFGISKALVNDAINYSWRHLQ